MNKPSANLLVAVVDDFVCVKIAGRATFTSSIDFKKLIQQLQERGFAHFIVDLSECVIMDSTFLGVLAGVGLKFCDDNGNAPQGHVELLNPNARLTDLLENLGVSHLFRIVQQTTPAADRFEPVACVDASRSDVTRNCLEAHELLMRLNPENAGRFKDVARFLAEDLKAAEKGKP